MDIGIDLDSWQKAGGFAGATSAAPERRREWRGLRARLDAAYAARQALLADGPVRLRRAGGSFDRGSARIVANYGPAGSVNRTDLASGKSTGNIRTALAGAITIGDRG